MEKTYKKIDYLGSSLLEVVHRLWDYQKSGVFVSTEFNGHTLYSDEVSLNGAYREITGRTYFEAEEENRKWHEKYEQEEREFKEKIPSLVVEWKQKGHEVLERDYWEYWDSIVQIRLEDLYHGMELECCLEIVKELNKNCSLDDAKKLINNQSHSGMSYGLVRNMVGQFCKRGEDFCKYTKL